MAVTLTDKVRFYESVFGTGRMARNCRNFDVRCPICAPADHSKKKLAILVDDDRCHCWVCGYKSRTLAPLIRKYGTQPQLTEYVARFMPVSVGGSRRCIIMTGELPPAERVKLPDDFRMLVVTRSKDPDFVAAKRYVERRGLTEDDCWFYKLGYSDRPEWRRRVIVPSFDANGDLNHFVARAIDASRRPKYEAPGGDRSGVIFNEINIDWSRQVVVCEGVFDAMKCGENVVPLLGSDLNEESTLFNSIVANGTSVALALDADMRYTKVPRIARRLAGYNIDVSLVDVTSDPGDMSKKEFRSALAAARQFDWHTGFADMLDRAACVRL